MTSHFNDFVELDMDLRDRFPHQMFDLAKQSRY
jgi:hypothetical protein